ncbi:MAG TPA: glycoside hydrolase family 27 protein [Caulobacterales bacterium]|nr:glycoside hydrolase family 27 protein [Caulobacterales bacterium]
MRVRGLAFVAILFTALYGTASARPASAPPMGWNSWDAYGTSLTEESFKANAQVVAGLHRYGWTYVTVDWGWFMRNPFGSNAEERQYLIDGNGLLMPDPAHFPSAADGRGFRTLADWVHARGLKFGVHIIRGIPKSVVRDNLPIANSAFHAADAADTSDTCPWDDANYGVRDNQAGQAYYDSEMRLLASWGVDFVKVDCISDHPYKGAEIRMVSEAIRRSGRDMVLSLSPGPTNISHADEVKQAATMWRIADDFWDGWEFPHAHPTDTFPMGVRGMLDLLAQWNPHAGDGRWPDADMLPIGSLTPHPGWREARASRLTPDETRSTFTMWAIARSPLILGANLTVLDAETRAIITQREVIALNQRAGESHPVTTLPAGFENARVWTSTPRGARRPDTVAIVNVADTPLDATASWSSLGLGEGPRRAREIWTVARLPRSETLHVTIAPHAVALFHVN